ncbi:homoserine O-succinyltransferase MetX [Teredinibacter turnerae]|uniref:Homoserine O-succinyltransferase n=1 Tax=Teredinibacter turnerae (strain ATCC 39867 / T7901) TaxID=377629 RepID=METXS_TERTT|nr:homoserine O-acetyltransferase [Teredinibacter turnerae]C5BLJ8.1 RecName: Full=Homoserine O-succinyltransferase; Short=HST; AltName: Full=Homoserine transsuccinylase; Short=HTS [Teredinibacter turnerae T7901]ACR11399.1 homoserine O-acetyltransferase [Teredinibacter turnerae T7901]
MPDSIPANSVGLVTPQLMQFDEPLALACGRTLDSYQLMVETYGTLNASRTNALLICHALSGHHHAAGYHSMDERKPGWWDAYIGPGKPLDTNKFFIVSLNNIGGCHGSTGPVTPNPSTGQPWGGDFPTLRVRDWVHSQARLADALGIQKWAAVVGGSLGGMQAMRWSLEYPDRVGHCVVIASAMKLSAQNIAFNHAAREAILTDPDFHDGNFLSHSTVPKRGLSTARVIAHLTYLSDDGMGQKFGRELRSGSFEQGTEEPVEFQIESYLRYQADSFSKVFDANTYVLMTRALDYFDLAREYGDDPVEAFKQAQCKYMVISFTSDWRFSPERSREIVNALIRADRDVVYGELESDFGHDAFLIPNQPRYWDLLTSYMSQIEVAD